MASGIDCRVEEDTSPVTVVRLHGPLDMTTARPVHAVLQRCLAAQPEALVVDMATVRVRQPLALSVFAAAARQAALWPDVPVLLCETGRESADWLAGTRAGRRVRVRDSRAEALWEARREARQRTASPRVRTCLQPVAQACRWARDLAGEACQRWGVPDLTGPARLVLSELVANAVRHAGTPMEVTLVLRRPYLHLAVADGSGAPVRPPRRQPASTEGGRGLLLVREVTQRWGWLPASGGKVVWARLST